MKYNIIDDCDLFRLYRVAIDLSLLNACQININLLNGQLQIDIRKLKYLAMQIKRSLSNEGVISIAVVTCRPMDTALAMIVQKYLENSVVSIKVFSTEDGAQFWLNSISCIKAEFEKELVGLE